MIEAKKVLGQNFLVDKNKINEIVNAIPITKKSIVVEVGPGTGALTTELVDKVEKLIAIEIDNDMVPILKSKIYQKNFSLINTDILKVDLDTLSNANKIDFVSNLPYYISSKIIFKVATNNKFKTVSIMLQKELVDRIFAEPNNKTYGRLTVAINSLFLLQKRINVPANCFKPKPNVDSGFIVLERKDLDFDIDDYLKFIKHSFANKRKTLLNSLKNSNYLKVDDVKTYFEKEKIKLNIRAEEIPVEKFIEIYKKINR